MTMKLPELACCLRAAALICCPELLWLQMTTVIDCTELARLSAGLQGLGV